MVGDGTSDSMVSLKATQKTSRPKSSTSAVLLPGSLQKIADDIDIVHRLGKYQGSQNGPRTTMIRFTSRSTRDLQWRTAKKSEYLESNKLRQNIKRKALFLFAKFSFFQEFRDSVKNDAQLWKAQWGDDIWFSHAQKE